MIENLSLRTLATVLNGHLSGDDCTVRTVCSDSRQLCPGDLFIALKGPHFNGHDYVRAAKEKGAIAALVSEQQALDLSQIVVPDVLQALGEWASYVREQIACPVIALTGSCGKTTTKNMIASILSLHHRVLCTQGNLNNAIGLPLTLLQLTPAHDVAVLEMGANHLNEIAYLSQIGKPDIALITNIRPVHLQGFGSLDGVARGKAEIFQGMSPAGTAVIDSDNQYAKQWLQAHKTGPVITFGIDPLAMIRAHDCQLDAMGRASFVLQGLQEEVHIHLSLLGLVNVNNALAASAVCHAMHIKPDIIRQGLEQVLPVQGRLLSHRGYCGATVIDDTYNANPSALQAALSYLAQCSGITVLVMADMGELGNASASYHQAIGEQAKALQIDHLFATGEQCALTCDAFGAGGKFFSDRSALVRALKAMMSDSVTVLVKGSRSYKMEDIVAQLINEGV